MGCKARPGTMQTGEAPKLKSMPARLKFIVAYDGAPFAGWQSQAGGNTIQDRLESAFKRITGAPARVHGAGRTDAGVHALAQSAHVDLPDRRLTTERWIAALNAHLPAGIRVRRCRYVSESFHARFSAKGKVYRYRIWNAPVLPPFEHERAWHIRAQLDFKMVSRAAQCFQGRHDFAAFAASSGKPESSTVRTIRSVRLRRAGPLITIDFEGDGFLYKMVRLIVGSLADCGLEKISSSEIGQRLETGKVRTRVSRHAAPASGLFLVRVRY